MLVFGIDPGSVATGFAAVRRRSGRFQLEGHGVIRTRSSDPIPERLRVIHEQIAGAGSEKNFNAGCTVGRA